MIIRSLALIAFTSVLAACGSDSKSDNKSDNTSKNIDLKFAAQVNSNPLACDVNTGETAGTANTTPNVKHFSLYISQLEVATDKGEFVPVKLNSATSADAERGISLIAFCGSSLKNSEIKGTVEKADNYSRVRFTIGVPEKYNHLDATKNTGILSKEISMHWSWTKGFKHARMDIEGWNIHLGSTACTGEAAAAQCANSNRPTYNFRNFDLKTDKIVLDYAKLVETSDISKNTQKTAPGCMSHSTDPECGKIFTALGLELNNGQCKSNDCDSQSWVSSAKK